MKRAPFFISLLLLPSVVHGQGSLIPPAGPPAANMKTLQEIWNKVGTLETQLTQTQADLTTARADITRLREDNKQLSSLLALSPESQALPWIITTIGNGGQYNSLTFGPDGYPAISHYAQSDAKLRFSRNNGSTWTTTIVETNSFAGTYSSLAFAPGGQPAIAYYDAANTNLKYARFNGVAWDIATVDNNAGNVGQHASLGFNGDGRAVIAYYDTTNGDLKVARHNGAFFELSTIDSTGDVGKNCSLAIGPDGQPGIVYSNLTGQSVKFARYNGSAWTFFSQGSTVEAPQGNLSLAFGPSGRMSTPFYNDTTLRLAEENLFSVSVSSSLGPDSSLAFGTDGSWWVAYREPGASYRLRVAKKEPAYSADYTYLPVDNSFSTGKFNSIAIGPDGQPAVAYYDEANGTLKVARRGIFKPFR